MATLLLACSAATAAGEIAKLTSGLPDIDAPPQGRAQWVARSMRLNGLPMTIKSFNSSMSVDDIFFFYEHWWTGKGLAKYTRSSLGERRMLGIHSDQYAITIEARQTISGTEGTITVSPKLENVARPATLFPHPDSMSVVTLQEYDDNGVEAEHISMESSRDAFLESREFAALLQRQGWQLVINRRATTQSGGYVIEAQKGAQQVQMVFTSSNDSMMKTQVAVIWIKS